MLQTFYNSLGFAGAFSLAFFLFVFFIFWMAGIAGICAREENDPRIKNVRIFLAVLIPVYPFAWMIVDMFKQKKKLKGLP